MKLRNFLFEAEKDTIGIFTGRFQPPHNGHNAIIQAMSKENYLNYVFVVEGSKSSSDKEKNPISGDDRIKILKKIVPGNVAVLKAPNSYIPDLIDMAQKHLPFDIKKVIIYAGNDRSSSYARFIKDIEKKGIKAEVNTKDFNRSGVSGTKVRELLKGKDYKEAQKYLPYDTKLIKDYF